MCNGYENRSAGTARGDVAYWPIGHIAFIQFSCYLKLLGAVIKIILSSPGLLQHLCTLLLLHLLFVLQICYFLILIFNLPEREKSIQNAFWLLVRPSACELDWRGVVPSNTVTFHMEKLIYPLALPSNVKSI